MKRSRERIPEGTDKNQTGSPDCVSSLRGAGCPAQVFAVCHWHSLINVPPSGKSCLTLEPATPVGWGRKAENKLFRKPAHPIHPLSSPVACPSCCFKSMKTVVLETRSGSYSDALNIHRSSAPLEHLCLFFFFFEVTERQGKPSPDQCSDIYGV